MASQNEPMYSVAGPRLIGELAWPDVADLATRTRTVVLACGSFEQHGPHMPLLSDWFQGEDLIRRVVRRLSADGVVVAGGLCVPFAPAEDALSFAGSLSVTNETYIRLIVELLDGLLRHGFCRAALIICHEQAMGPAMAAVRAFNSANTDASAAVLTGWYQAGVAAIRESVCTGPRPHQDGHAGEIETSRMLAARPELVDLARAGVHYPDAADPLPHSGHPLAGGGLYRPSHDFRTHGPQGFVGAAAEATIEKGEHSIDLAVSWICDVIKRDLL